MNAEQPSSPSLVAFDTAHAERYDERFAPLAPAMQALHLLMRATLADLPPRARILCVGAGTGAELLYLARANPGWQFTALDPSAAMLDVCRRKAEAAGVLDRCEFHHGYLDSLPPTQPFDAATCVLVSQFLLDREQRIGLFKQIAARLRMGGWLINADLCADLDDPRDGQMLELWMQLMKHAGVSAEEREQLRKVYRRDVSILPAAEIESMLGAAGFIMPLPFYQSVLIRAWASRTSDLSPPEPLPFTR